jgi:hypothetical protein
MPGDKKSGPKTANNLYIYLVPIRSFARRLPSWRRWCWWACFDYNVSSFNNIKIRDSCYDLIYRHIVNTQNINQVDIFGFLKEQLGMGTEIFKIWKNNSCNFVITDYALEQRKSSSISGDYSGFVNQFTKGETLEEM